ncbi:MAG: alpha/beta hydrolase [Flavobacteriales bacterium]|nr:alpha/beta hydrolase [Flavobacteriales bacterium]
MRALTIFVASLIVSFLACSDGIATSTATIDESEAKWTPVYNDSVTVTTYLYFMRKEVDMYLDVHEPADSNELKPTVIFIHGGGFFTGTRKEDNIEHFCDSLARNGIRVVNMDYFLYLKGQSFHCDQPSENKMKAFDSVSADLSMAIKFLKEDLNLDLSSLFIAGSSAGAEVVLHAPYGYKSRSEFAAQDKTEIKGLLAFAGAMIDTSLVTKDNAIPTMLFHGSCDPLVPYGSDTHHYCPEKTVGALMLHGSYSIFQRMAALDQTVRLVTHCGAKHSIASKPIENDIQDILDFITRVQNDEHFIEHEVRESADCKYGDWEFCAP